MSLYKEDGSEVKLNFEGAAKAKKKTRAQSAGAAVARQQRRPLKVTERQYSKETLADAYKIFDK